MHAGSSLSVQIRQHSLGNANCEGQVGSGYREYTRDLGLGEVR